MTTARQPKRPSVKGFEDIDGIYLAPNQDELPLIAPDAFVFHSCILRAVSLSENHALAMSSEPSDSDGSALSGQRSPVELKIASNLRAINDAMVEVRVYVDGSIGADIPFKLRMVHSAFFRAGEQVGRRRLVQAVSEGGMLWIFPYIREAISSITQRTIAGAVMLDLITHVTPIASQQDIDRIAPPPLDELTT